MAVTLDIDTLRDNYIGEQDYRAFSQGSETIAERWLTRGMEFVESVFDDNGEPEMYIVTDNDISEAIMQRACFEAYYKGRQYQTAYRHRDICQEILIRILGSGADLYGEVKDIKKKKTKVTTTAGTTSWKGFGKWDRFS